MYLLQSSVTFILHSLESIVFAMRGRGQPCCTKHSRKPVQQEQEIKAKGSWLCNCDITASYEPDGQVPLTLASEIFTYSLKDEGHQTVLGSPGLTGSCRWQGTKKVLRSQVLLRDHMLYVSVTALGSLVCCLELEQSKSNLAMSGHCFCKSPFYPSSEGLRHKHHWFQQ